MSHEGTSFASGCAASFEAVFAAKELDELVEQDKENSAFVMFFRGDWFKYKFAAGWSAVAMATIKPAGKERTVVAVSPGGAYWEVEPKSLQEVHGRIDAAENSLRSLEAIEDVIYACGMGRSVLRRKSAGVWQEIGPGTVARDKGSVIGFEDIGGFSADDMYAAGWRGEVWQRKKGKWRRLDSPADANLNALCCASDGNVYIVGDDGIMLRGRNDVWEVLETGRTENLMDVAFYNNITYVVTDFQILKLSAGSLVPEREFADKGDVPGTCLHLFPSTDGLFSMGPKDLFRLHGPQWERLV